jgi:hypothetical protein
MARRLALKSRVELADLVPENGLFIELGVARGNFARQVLARHPTLRYLGVDKWDDHHDEKEQQQAQSKLEAFKKRSILWRMQFDEAVQDIPDDTAHLVYVDGYAHTGQHGGDTLRDWWPKVRPGSWLCGHDYARRWPLTVRAVDRFAREMAVPVHVIPERDPGGFASWAIQKPVHPQPLCRLDSRVVLVGNGPSLRCAEHGDAIDTFDEVVRLNRYKLADFQAHTGKRTTVWATVGHGELPQENDALAEKVLLVHENQRPGYYPDQLWRIPLSYLYDVSRRVRAHSTWPNANKILASSGIIVGSYLLEVIGLPQIWVAGIDHFAKTKTEGRHHYWLDTKFTRPAQHDGDAEARFVAPWKFEGRWRSLTD